MPTPTTRSSPSETIKRLLGQAAQALAGGDLTRARDLLEQAAAVHRDHPDRLHLLGLVERRAGNLAAAERYLAASLEARPRQPAVLGNLGNLLNQQGRTGEAEAAYRRALEIDGNFADAARNLGLLLASTERDEEAVSILERVVGQRQDDVGAWTTLGQCHRRLGDFDRSVASFQRALALRPQHANAIAGLGQTFRLLARPAAAAACFDRVLESNPDTVEVLVARADATAEQGLPDEAVSRYRRVIDLAPGHVGAHVQLSELLWQMGGEQRYGEPFARSLARDPDNPELLAAWCRGLANTGAGDQALRELETRPTLVARHPQLLAELGKRLAAAGQNDAAGRAFDQALALAPDVPDINLEFAQFVICRADYPRALAALERTERIRPDDQLMWACRGLCWRLMGDPRADWLNDESRLIGTYEIDCPPGYAGVEGFLAALAETLERIHDRRMAPAGQSLRGGTQTAPRLFYRPDRVIQDLRWSLDRVVAGYIRSLPDDPHHPMLRRRSERFRYQGSWSVRLGSGGYHVNHVHPQGWISSSHYVTVPREVAVVATRPAGWLKFGESGLGLGERERITHLVRPAAGQVTLFPSYFWHGTVPFESKEPRMTTPFDVVPGR